MSDKPAAELWREALEKAFGYAQRAENERTRLASGGGSHGWVKEYRDMALMWAGVAQAAAGGRVGG